MGIEKSPLFYSGDGSVYVCNTAEKQWYRMSPAVDLPADVKAQIRELKEKADALKDA